MNKRKTAHGCSVPPNGRGMHMPMGRIALDEQRERPWLLSVSGWRFKGRPKFWGQKSLLHHRDTERSPVRWTNFPTACDGLDIQQSLSAQRIRTGPQIFPPGQTRCISGLASRTSPHHLVNAAEKGIRSECRRQAPSPDSLPHEGSGFCTQLTITASSRTSIVTVLLIFALYKGSFHACCYV